MENLLIFETGASQGNDLGPSTDLDSEPVRAAKLRIREIITEWVENFDDDD